MKRIICLFCALALLLALGACGARPAPQPSVSEDLTTPEPAAEATPEPSPEPTSTPELGAPAILSPGAAEDSALSMPFREKDSTLLTGAATGDGITYLGDVLPIGDRYVSSLLFCDDGILAAVKDYFFSMDPTSLILFPEDGGEGRVLADNLIPSNRFVLAGDAVFFRDYDDGELRRLDRTTGEIETVSSGVTDLFAAAGGFLYYTKADGLYRNDSTAGAEVRLYDDSAIGEVAAEGTNLCILTGNADGSAGVLVFLQADGARTAKLELPGIPDNILCRNGKLYVPQIAAGSVFVFDMATGETLDPIALDTLGFSCIVHEVTDDALYYETVLDTGFVLCRVPLAGGPAEVVGNIIM